MRECCSLRPRLRSLGETILNCRFSSLPRPAATLIVPAGRLLTAEIRKFPPKACTALRHTAAGRQVFCIRANSSTLEEAERDSRNSCGPSISLYNSLTKKKEAFRPRAADGTVSMYVCGVTVYDFSHIGHARVYINFDILYRYLQYAGYKVHYVRNFTDIDDKIINRAQERGESPENLSARFITEFHKDMEALNCLSPTLQPKATDNIPAIIEDVKQIIANGSAYQSGGDVYFDVATSTSYGSLSGRRQEDNQAGKRVAVDERKRNPADFALWKAGKENEPQWESPWGRGRPGWHIECSAMIRHLIGPAIDIHGGGRDLLFPHHENELAQAHAASGACKCDQPHDNRDFVNFWLHNGFVNVDSEKMSKSLGNFFTIREVTQQYHPLALRLFLVNSQYRAAINYTIENLDAAAERLYYIYQTVCDLQAVLEQSDAENAVQDLQETTSYKSIIAALHLGLADDLNTSLVLSALADPLRRANDFCHTRAGRKAKHRMEEVSSLHAALKEVLGVMGLWKEPATVLREMHQLALTRAKLTEAELSAAIESRAAARKAGDFARADQVREAFLRQGIQILDTGDGTKWRPTWSHTPQQSAETS